MAVPTLINLKFNTFYFGLTHLIITAFTAKLTIGEMMENLIDDVFKFHGVKYIDSVAYYTDEATGSRLCFDLLGLILVLQLSNRLRRRLGLISNLHNLHCPDITITL